MNTTPELRLAIDIGGTFTDTVIMGQNSRILGSTKVTTTAQNPALGALEGASAALQELDAGWDQVASFIHGTTLATNALIERRGAKVATITNDGFRDILEIAYERRYSQYDINIEKPDLIVSRDLAFTIEGRMNAQGREIIPLAAHKVDALAEALTKNGIQAVAICLLHAYANPTHELRLRALLQERMPKVVISLSHQVSPEAREFDRLCTTIANAYIQPLMSSYLSDFKDRFVQQGLKCPILMMTAAGGMTTIDTAARLPIRLVESGPAGGAILAARIAAQTREKEILSFDMGGTTAKLCLIDGFRPQAARKFEIARAERFVKGSGMPVRIPVLEMIEIGAGGGSIAGVDRLGRVTVGPKSAGSAPGPAGFSNGGTDATVTDADIVQGYIDNERFAEGRLSIDPAASEDVLMTHIGEPLGVQANVAATAVNEIVDEAMASAGRMHAVESGKDLSTRLMIALGGNGPLHATRVARRAGIRRILIPPDPGVGSAVGFLHAPVSFEIIRSHYTTLNNLDTSAMQGLFAEMRNEAEKVVRAGAPEGPLLQRCTAFMRYRGQGHEIEIELQTEHFATLNIDALTLDFETEYSRQFGRVVPGMAIEILNWGFSLASASPRPEPLHGNTTSKLRVVDQARRIWCNISNQWVDAALFDRATLSPGDQIAGPALIVEPQTTTFVSAGFDADIDAAGNIWLTDRKEEQK